TRAEKEATLSYAQSRYRWGNLIYCEPSRFLDELDQDFLDRQEIKKARKTEVDETPWQSSFSHSTFNQKKTFSKKETAEKKTFTPPKNLKKVSSNSESSVAEIDLKVGSNVKHERFGKGKVISIDGESPNQKATVFFPTAGQKQLLLRFAKLEVLNE